MELHIFDFDGTLFYSPAPSYEALSTAYGTAVFNSLTSPLEGNGLGWFQSLTTLCPPAVPEKPSLAEWYVTPLVEKIHSLHSHNAKHEDGTDSRARLEDDQVRCFVLTGRDEKYRARIEGLLNHAGLLSEMTQVFLKPTETAGTVKYKLNTIYELVRRYQPRRVYYYDDRPEQGGKLFAGIQRLQKAMYPSTLCEEAASLELVPLLSRDNATPPPAHRDRPIDFSSLFDGNERREEEAVRVAQRWVDSTMNSLHPHYGKRALKPVEAFTPPPPFHFTLLLVPPELAERSEQMLSSEAQRQLVEALMKEREAYDAGDESFAEFRKLRYDNRTRGAGGGRARGARGSGGGHVFDYGYGRGANRAAYTRQGRGRGAAVRAEVHETKKWTSPSEYPSLPPA